MPPASLAGLGEKLGADPRIGQPACCGLCREPFFLRSSGICPNLSAPRERLSRTGTTHRKHTLGVCGLAWEAYVSCWSGFPFRVYIDSNRRDSRI
jgi:hypothetical protein